MTPHKHANLDRFVIYICPLIGPGKTSHRSSHESKWLKFSHPPPAQGIQRESLPLSASYTFVSPMWHAAWIWIDVASNPTPSRVLSLLLSAPAPADLILVKAIRFPNPIMTSFNAGVIPSVCSWHKCCLAAYPNPAQVFIGTR